VIVADPDIYEFEINEEDDFLMLGCDGIYDSASNEELNKFVWLCKDGRKNTHEQAGEAVDNVIRLSAYKESYDNLTCVLIAFRGFGSGNEYAKLSEKVL